MTLSTKAQTAYDMLDSRQRKYVDERLKGNPPRDAALSAGYSEQTAINRAYELLERHPVIKVVLRETGRAALKNLCLTREHVLHGLMDAVDHAATATELTNAWREIGRVIGAYEPEKVQIDISALAPEELRTMPLSELAALADMQGVFDGTFRIVNEAEAAEEGVGAERQGQEAEGLQGSVEEEHWRGPVAGAADGPVRHGEADG
jgi:hypothetical protein